MKTKHLELRAFLILLSFGFFSNNALSSNETGRPRKADKVESSLFEEFGPPLSQGELHLARKTEEEERIRAYQRQADADRRLHDLGVSPDQVLSGDALFRVLGEFELNIKETEAERGTWDHEKQLFSDFSLSPQFTGDPRNQGPSKSCLTFASTAALEAALLRGHGVRVDLSEMAILRLKIGEDLAHAGRSLRNAGYLGTTPKRILDLVKKYGSCSEAAFPFDADALSAFLSFADSSGVSTATYFRRLEIFSRTMGLFQSDRLSKCKEESETIKRASADLVSGTLMSSDIDHVLHFLALGIPLILEITNFGGQAGLMHAVLAVGYDLPRERFLIRNWKGSRSEGTVLFRTFRGQALSRLSAPPSFIFSLNERARLCARIAGLPRELMRYCVPPSL